jgi:hypothetical protein
MVWFGGQLVHYFNGFFYQIKEYQPIGRKLQKNRSPKYQRDFLKLSNSFKNSRSTLKCI